MFSLCFGEENPLKATDFIFILNLICLQVQAVLKRKEEEDQQMKQVVQTLQLALDKEKTKVKDLKEQVKQGSRVTLFAFI